MLAHGTVSYGCHVSHPIIDFAQTPAAHRVARLFEDARDVQDKSYAPYSHFKVGAAILTAQGNIYVGCNVENAAYPVGNCAEASAIAAMKCSLRCMPSMWFSAA